MYYSELNSHCRDEISSLVIKDLYSTLKFKVKKEKPRKITANASNKIFGQPIQSNKLIDVTLENNSSVQIPIFVARACSRILEGVQTEGIFRRGGSQIRQKAIRVSIYKFFLNICRYLWSFFFNI